MNVQNFKGFQEKFKVIQHVRFKGIFSIKRYQGVSGTLREGSRESQRSLRDLQRERVQGEWKRMQLGFQGEQ